MELAELTQETSVLSLEKRSRRKLKKLGPELMYMGRDATYGKAAMKEQAVLISLLFNQTEMEIDEEDDSKTDPETNILDLSNELLVKIISFVGTKMKESDIRNQCVNEMLRLKLVCRRFRNLIENHATLLPKYHLIGIRLQPKEFKAVKGTVIVHRYGTGEFEIPCACLLINEVPSFLKYGEIRGHLITDSLTMDDTLILMLLNLNLKNVRTAVFSSIRVNLKDTTLVNKLLCRLSNAESIRFFGKYQEDELHLDMNFLSDYVERGPLRENRSNTSIELRALAQQYKFKKGINKERSAARYQKLKEMGKDLRNKNRYEKKKHKGKRKKHRH